MKTRAQHAFTLIELMVTLALLAVLLTLAAPSFRDFYRSSQLSSHANTLIAGLMSAKNEAIKHNAHSYLQPRDGRSWQSGWMIFVDHDFDGQFNSAKDVQIAESPPLPATLRLRGNGTSGEAAPYVGFDSSGYPARKNSSGFSSLSMTLDMPLPNGSATLQNTRHIKIAATGRVHTCKPKSLTDALCSTPSYASN